MLEEVSRHEEGGEEGRKEGNRWNVQHEEETGTDR